MKKFTLFALVLALGATILMTKKESEAEAFPTKIGAKAMLVVDYATGEILYENNSSKRIAVAGLSKMMTEYIVLNAIDANKLYWNDLYTPSEYVLAISGLSSIVNLGMKEDERYSVKELFEAMSIVSANDATVALTEMVSGIEESFVILMNDHANYFGLDRTIFYNASGLDGQTLGKEETETNLSSAQDVAFLARKLISRHPEILYFTGRRDFRTNKGIMRRNPNLMLRGMPHVMKGIDGLKTGFTDEAGPCFVATGVFGGRRIVTVVIGVDPVGTDIVNPRFKLTKDLIEGFIY